AADGRAGHAVQATSAFRGARGAQRARPAAHGRAAAADVPLPGPPLGRAGADNGRAEEETEALVLHRHREGQRRRRRPGRSDPVRSGRPGSARELRPRRDVLIFEKWPACTAVAVTWIAAGWQLLQAASAALALTARLAARGDEEAAGAERSMRKWWLPLATLAPELAGIDLV